MTEDETMLVLAQLHTDLENMRQAHDDISTDAIKVSIALMNVENPGNHIQIVNLRIALLGLRNVLREKQLWDYANKIENYRYILKNS